MPHFRRRVPTVEAVRVGDVLAAGEAAEGLPDWVRAGWVHATWYVSDGHLSMTGYSGWLAAEDWLVLESNGDVYRASDDEFRAIYVPTQED